MSGYDAKRLAGRTTANSERGELAANQGQRHDRIPDDLYLSGPPEPPLPGRDHNGDIEITVGQKMLSAMSGSFLTSLIGTRLFISFEDSIRLLIFLACSHTPRCCSSASAISAKPCSCDNKTACNLRTTVISHSPTKPRSYRLL